MRRIDEVLSRPIPIGVPTAPPATSASSSSDAVLLNRHRKEKDAVLLNRHRKEKDAECSLCGGLGWVRLEVPYGHAEFGQARPCPCGLVARRRLQRIDAVFGFTPQLQAESFATLIPIEGSEEAIEATHHYVAHPSGWLYLWGPVGDGKTKLLAIAINALRASGYEAVFCVVPELLSYLRATFEPDSPVRFDETFDYLKSAPLLGLDDLGAESPSPWVNELLYELFGWRYRAELPTIVTSNARPELIRDPRLASRLRDVRLCTVAYCGRTDVRQLCR